MIEETNIEWSIRTWKERHDNGYFPKSDQHRDWKVYDNPPDWLMSLAKPTKEDTVLEVGCGYGEWMIPLSPYVAGVEGFDIHPSPVRKAIEKFAELGLESLNATLGDGTRIPYSESTFSLVYSISVFQHLPRDIVRGYLVESMRVLAPKGRMFHHFRNADNIGPYPTPATDIVVNHKDDFSVGWTKGQIADLTHELELDIVVHDLGLFLVMEAYV